MYRMTRRVLVVMLGCVAGALAATPATARVHPGAMTFTKGAQCTSNFVFADRSATYLGQAAHCAGTGAATETDGCRSESRPIGTPVRIKGARARGTLVYSSWLAMQRRRTRNLNACAYNDFALVKLGRADARRVDPTVPVFGGPTGLGGAAPGDAVYSYGNSSLRPDGGPLSPKRGLILERQGAGWSWTVETVTPGIPGDSGSGFLNDRGEAIGVLSTLNIAPGPGTNGVGGLRKELRYMRRHSSFSHVHLVEGREPFDPDPLRAILGS
jgi:hypothetical protein